MERINIVKYGTDVLTRLSGGEKVIAHDVMKDHGRVINAFRERLILVTSGAVGVGKDVVQRRLDYISDEAIRRRLLAGAGNPVLSTLWSQAIPRKVLIQGLITDRMDAEEAQSLIKSLYQVPDEAIFQINGNDVTSPDEMTGDNDVNTSNLAIWSSAVAEKVRAIYCTLEEGLYEHFGTDQQKLVPEICAEDLTDAYLRTHCKDPSSKASTGGMLSKAKALRRAVLEGQNVEGFIIGGKNSENLAKVFAGESVGTRVVRGNLSQV